MIARRRRGGQSAFVLAGIGRREDPASGSGLMHLRASTRVEVLRDGVDFSPCVSRFG
jgi:hypothetical protein